MGALSHWLLASLEVQVLSCTFCFFPTRSIGSFLGGALARCAHALEVVFHVEGKLHGSFELSLCPSKLCASLRPHIAGLECWLDSWWRCMSLAPVKSANPPDGECDRSLMV